MHRASNPQFWGSGSETSMSVGPEFMIFTLLLSRKGALSRLLLALAVVALIWIGFGFLTQWGQG